MVTKYTIGVILLLTTGLLLSGQLRAENPLHGAKGEKINILDGGCQFQATSTPLIQAVLEQITSSSDLTNFWKDSHQLAGLLREIDELRVDGLNPEHYSFSLIQQLHTRVSDGHDLTGCEIDVINHAYVSALKDLYFGRVDPVEKKLFWYADGVRNAPSEKALLVLAELGIEREANQAFEAARPVLPEYQGLRDAYKKALANFPQSWTRVPDGSLLKTGDADIRVATIQRRLTEGGYQISTHANNGRDQIFSPELGDAVKKFQHDHSLLVDGVVGPDTIAEMNIKPSTRTDQLKANLERLRWFSQDNEDTMVLVDIAGAEISYLQECNKRILTRVQAGRPKRETPPLKSLLSHVTLNPTWTIPPTILKEDVLPAVREDINYLSERHIRVIDYSGNELDPETIDWDNPGAVILRQDAGPYAALGKVVIRFPNPFLVYLHDTPSTTLFDTGKRFYSSGCVRVENVMTLTELLFESTPKTLLEKFIEAKSSEKPVNVSLPTRIPLLMVYWTAIVDEDGNLRFRPDIYERDSELLALLEQP